MILDDRVLADKKEYKALKSKHGLKKQNKVAVEKFKHFYGIVGFIQLLQGYYMIVITQMTTLAKLGRNSYFIKYLNNYSIYITKKKKSTK